MINQLIQQLQDPNPDVRRRAILALGRSKDAGALKPLAMVVRGDADPALRDLARKAGQYIRQQTQIQTRAAQPPQPPPPPKVSPFIDDPESAADNDMPTTGSLLDDDMPTTGTLLNDDLPTTGALTTRGNPSGYTPRQWFEDPPEEMLSEPKLTTRAPAEPAPSVIKSLDTGETAEPAPPPTRTTIVRGRKYNVAKADQDRAKKYADAALSLNIQGDNAKAMKQLTEALSIDPNLINDGYFNNVAAAVTGLEGDEATRMIIDYRERKSFTVSATQQKKEQRVEKHMNEVKTASWTDVWFEMGIYSLIMIAGSIAVVVFAAQGAQTLASTFSKVGKDLPDALKNSQATFAGLTIGALLPLGIITGISGVISLLIQTVIIHFIAKAFHGLGTWANLIRVLVGFYNKWFLILFAVLCITSFVIFWSAFSPVALCFVLVFVILLLYITAQTSTKVGEAYDFGGAKGCLSVIGSSLVILVINSVLGYAMSQMLASVLSQARPG